MVGPCCPNDSKKENRKRRKAKHNGVRTQIGLQNGNLQLTDTVLKYLIGKLHSSIVQGDISQSVGTLRTASGKPSSRAVCSTMPLLYGHFLVYLYSKTSVCEWLHTQADDVVSAKTAAAYFIAAAVCINYLVVKGLSR